MTLCETSRIHVADFCTHAGKKLEWCLIYDLKILKEKVS